MTSIAKSTYISHERERFLDFTTSYNSKARSLAHFKLLTGTTNLKITELCMKKEVNIWLMTSPCYALLCELFSEAIETPTKAKFRCRSSHELNYMLLRKHKGFFSFAFDSAHVKYGVSVNLTQDIQYGRRLFTINLFPILGIYDPLLTWPFSYRTTFYLLDQNSDLTKRKHIMFSVKPNICPENEPFLGRPRTSKNPSFGSGKFVSHKDIQEGEYVKDNTIFIKVCVENDGLSEPWSSSSGKSNFLTLLYDIGARASRIVWVISKRSRQRLAPFSSQLGLALDRFPSTIKKESRISRCLSCWRSKNECYVPRKASVFNLIENSLAKWWTLFDHFYDIL